MSEQYGTIDAAPVDSETFILERAKRMVAALNAGLPFARLRGCLQGADGAEFVVVDVEPEVPQYPVNDIRPVERIAVRVPSSDSMAPEALALRLDFPQVSHLNLSYAEWPKSLCLFDEPWSDVRLRWTPALMVNRVREWLALTARGELHQADQALEPMILGSLHTLVLPPSDHPTTPESDLGSFISVEAAQSPDGRYTLLASKLRSSGAPQTRGQPDPDINGPEWIGLTVRTPAHVHGVISLAPTTLRQLRDLLASTGFDLRAVLREQLDILRQTKATEAILSKRLILIVELPKVREEGGTVEGIERRAFLAESTLGDVGEAIGLWMMSGGHPGMLLPADDNKDGGDVGLLFLNVADPFTSELAARLNGLPPGQDLAVTAIGAGAVGSHVVNNLVRAGFGRWTVVDSDVLLPHNLARHSLPGVFVGHSKAEAVAMMLNSTIAGPPAVRAITEDILLTPSPDLVNALESSDLILDMSASVAVGRHVARNVTSSARRLSLFLNPDGSDLVLLAEDSRRGIPLDALEMQYYRYLRHEPNLAGHLETRAERVQVGLSCRDHSSRIPLDHVALYAALGAQAVRSAQCNPGATICVWRTSPDSLETNQYLLPASSVTEFSSAEWKVVVTDTLLTELSQQRNARLPDETGGILIGSVDVDRRLIYVVDSIPSPPDSEEWPMMYIRGAAGVEDEITRITSSTLGNLEYVGEWHSHPDGCSCELSADDRRVHEWITEYRAMDGRPALLLIVGEGGIVAWHVEDQTDSDVAP